MTDTDVRHHAFEAEFKALCDRHQVQATVFYAGFSNCVVAISRSYGRDQLAAILQRAAQLIPEITDAITTVVTGYHGHIRVHYE